LRAGYKAAGIVFYAKLIGKLATAPAQLSKSIDQGDNRGKGYRTDAAVDVDTGDGVTPQDILEHPFTEQYA
jgi:hypothetical protein